MTLKLKFFPDPILSSQCEEVTDFSETFMDMVERMKITLYSVPGLALAAPQVGCRQRIILLNLMKIQGNPETLVLINPKIKKFEGKIKMEEGCLSIPEVFENITRPERVEVKGIDLNGKEVAFEAEDILARAIQHEIDHLDGILFWDHLPDKERKKLEKKFLAPHPSEITVKK